MQNVHRVSDMKCGTSTVDRCNKAKLLTSEMNCKERSFYCQKWIKKTHFQWNFECKLKRKCEIGMKMEMEWVDDVAWWCKMMCRACDDGERRRSSNKKWWTASRKKIRDETKKASWERDASENQKKQRCVRNTKCIGKLITIFSKKIASKVFLFTPNRKDGQAEERRPAGKERQKFAGKKKSAVEPATNAKSKSKHELFDSK